MFRSFFKIMGKLDGLFLQDLINFSATLPMTDDGWFRCTGVFLEENGWSIKEQETRLKSLRDNGYVETQRRGIPNERWVRIDFVHIETGLDGVDPPPVRGVTPGGIPPDGSSPPSPNGGDRTPPNGGVRRPPNGGGIKNKTSSRSYSQQEETRRPLRGPTGVPPGGDSLVDQNETPVRKDSPRTCTIEQATPAPLIPRIVSPRDRAPRTEVTPADEALARRIRDFAVARGWGPPSTDRRVWAEALAIWRRRCVKAGLDPGELERRWDWYAARHGSGGLPDCRNGKSFVTRWDWISDRMVREQNKALPADVSSEAEWVVSELQALEWPASSGTQLPGVVEQSIRNYRSFCRRLSRVPDDLADLRDHLLGEISGAPEDHMLDWFRRVWDRVHGWSDWSGDLGRFVWRPDHPDFVRRAAAVVERYSQDRSAWSRLFAATKESA